jgi:hypothetical protein
MNIIALNKELNIDDLNQTTEIELTFDNICNLSCSYCDSSKSSSWALNINLNGAFNLQTSNLYNEVFEFDGRLIQKNLIKFISWWHNNSNQVTVLKINGGEPILSQYFWKFIHNISKSPNPELNLIIVSNLVYDPGQLDKLYDVSDKFKSIQIIASIDVNNGICDFLRAGGGYLRQKNNIMRSLGAPINCFLTLQNVISVFSVWYYSSFIEYNIELRKHSSTSRFDSLEALLNPSEWSRFATIPGNLRPFSSIILTSPSFQSILMLPTHLREYLYEDIFTTYSSLKSELHKPDKNTIIRCLNYIQSAKFPDNLESNRLSMERDLKKFIIEYEKIVRNDDKEFTSISSIFPKVFVDWLDTI